VRTTRIDKALPLARRKRHILPSRRTTRSATLDTPTRPEGQAPADPPPVIQTSWQCHEAIVFPGKHERTEAAAESKVHQIIQDHVTQPISLRVLELTRYAALIPLKHLHTPGRLELALQALDKILRCRELSIVNPPAH
jgi:hypothetical protein